MHTIFQTPRLIIREFLPEEEQLFLDHFTDEEMLLYLPKRSRDERINIFHKALANYANSKTLGTWGMFHKINGDLVGSCLLRLYNDLPGKVEVGYSIERKYWGVGIGTEMAIAMVGHAFADAGTTEVIGVTVPANIASQRVLEKAGLVRGDNFKRDDVELAYFRITSPL